jgi:RNA polymerase sigma-70 factor, ECF subfamily
MTCPTLCLESAREAESHLADAARSSLLSEARHGNATAFTALMLPYAPGLYRRALRLTGNFADAEDAQQEALLKAFTRLDQFAGNSADGQDDLHAWVSRITTNASIDLLRHRRDSKFVPLEKNSDDSEGSFTEKFAAREENPEERYARREMRLLMARAVTQLDPDLRRVCLLRDILQYTTQEVAEKLGISSVAVRLRLFRAHRRLQENLRVMLRRKQGRNTPLHPRATCAPRVDNFSSVRALAGYACGD